MALTDDVKLALRITATTALDSEISADITAATAELVRAGVDADVVNAEGPLVVQAIKTYVLSIMAPDLATRDGYQKSFELQEDNLRKMVVEEE